MLVEKTERGWGGHFIGASQCLFRRNTLLKYKNIRIVISTVGNYIYDNKPMEIGYNRYYETMIFHAHKIESYWDADVKRQIDAVAQWSICEVDINSDNLANEMHEANVKEITDSLINGRIKT